MDQLRFSLTEILMLLGAAQCIYVLVYMAFRSGRISRGSLPLLYFFVLGLAFLSDFAGGRIGEIFPYYFYINWAAWFLGPSLSVLLIIQIAQIHKTPPLLSYGVLLLLPISFLLVQLFLGDLEGCKKALPCTQVQEWLILAGVISGSISLFALWFCREMFTTLAKEKAGAERYWLILALFLMNAAFLLTILLSLSIHMLVEDLLVIRTFLGLGLAYLVGTSLFRIYPQAIYIAPAGGRKNFTGEEAQVLEQVKALFALEKIYHEPNYSRSDMARECGVSEAVLSKIINIHFKKSFPQLLNEHRISDAKRLLRETQAPIATISKEVGFNSLPSFNRVFKDLVQMSPSQYRKGLSQSSR